MSVTLSTVNAAIKAILVAYDSPSFTVIQGNPIGLPADGSPFACFWYEGRGDPNEGPMTLGNRMNAYRYAVRCFWHRQPELVTQEVFQDEIAAADQGLRAAFWGDYTLDGATERIDIGDSSVEPDGFFPLQTREGQVPRFYYTLEFPLTVWELEGEDLVA